MVPRLRHQGDDEQRFSVLAEKVLLLDGWGAAAVLLIRYFLYRLHCLISYIV